ncbi:MAG: MFS transporter, partial [Dehalococcoidales bacterium]|nr:MFS transporter [Dehalococcoidales bacterium]
KTGALWNMVTFYVVVAICYQIIMIHIVAAAIDVGITAAAAAVILTISGVTNTAGRLLVSSFAGRFGNKRVMVFCLAAQAVLLFLLMGAKSLTAFYVITGIYGFFYGGFPPMMPTLAGEYFGTKSIGGIFGMITFAYTLGAAIGPLTAGLIFDATGHYYYAFLAAAIAMAMAFLLSLTLKPPRKQLT